MKIFYRDFSKLIGFDYKNHKKPFYLLMDVMFVAQDEKEQIKATIPADFKSDGATLLKLFFFILGCSHNPQYLPAAIIHDWIIEHPESVNYNRNLSSRILRQALLDEGVANWKAQLMYLGVEFWQWFKNFFVKKWKR